MGREVVHDDPDLFGLGEIDVANLTHALREVDGGASRGDLDLSPKGSQGRWTSRKTKRLTVPLRLYSKS